MEQVLKEIITIEATAKAMIEDAAAQKAALSQAMEEEKVSFDLELAAKVEKEIEEIKKEISEKQQAQLDTWKQETKEAIDSLESYFNENHAGLVNSIVQQVLNN